MVLSIGSYSYQYNTRDNFGFAIKATYGEVNGQGREIFKDPITVDGTKKAAKSLMKIEIKNDAYELSDQVYWEQEKQVDLKEVFRDGKLLVDVSLAKIRKKLKE